MMKALTMPFENVYEEDKLMAISYHSALNFVLNNNNKMKSELGVTNQFYNTLRNFFKAIFKSQI